MQQSLKSNAVITHVPTQPKNKAVITYVILYAAQHETYHRTLGLQLCLVKSCLCSWCFLPRLFCSLSVALALSLLLSLSLALSISPSLSLARSLYRSTLSLCLHPSPRWSTRSLLTLILLLSPCMQYFRSLVLTDPKFANVWTAQTDLRLHGLRRLPDACIRSAAVHAVRAV